MDNDLFGVFYLYGIGEIDHSDWASSLLSLSL